MKLELIKASDVEIKEVEWLWYPYIPYGKVTVLQGDSGDGKSTFVLNLAAMLSRGEPMPFTDGSGQEPVNIIYQSSEDDADDTIVPRFVKAGGDPNRLIFISEKEKYLSFSDERLLEAVRKTKPTAVTAAPPMVWSCCSFSVRTGIHDITLSRIWKNLTERRQATPTL